MFEPDHSAKKKKVAFLPTSVTIAIIMTVVAGASFFGGIAYQKGKQPKTTQMSMAGQQGNFSGGRFLSGGARPVSGTVSAVSSSSITITENSGTTATFAITSSTTITNQGQAASASDITSGQTVFIVADSTNASNASRIIINPSFGGGFGGNSSSSTLQGTTQSN